MTYVPYHIADVNDASRRRLFTVVSMFAGGGGSSIGYRLAGGDVRLVNEFIKEAGRTYNANFPDTVVDGRDIRRINWKKTKTAHTGIIEFLASGRLSPGEIDILDGSPPCTEFSRAGRGLSKTWLMKKHSDSQQKGSGMLFYDYIYLVKRAKPKIFVAENVPDMATSKKNADLFNDFLDASRFYRAPGAERERAYYANWAVLNAADFGVPQSRKRMFLIGVRKDVAESVGIQSDEAVSDIFPQPTGLRVSVREALEGVRQSEGEVRVWRQAMLTSSQYHDVVSLQKNPPRVIGLRHIGIKDRNWNLQRCSWDLPAPTLTCSGQKLRSGLGGAIHPDADRKFTIAELKRLFGLPDDYRVTGTLDQASERLGNMVAPFVTKAIAESLFRLVLEPYYRSLDQVAAA